MTAAELIRDARKRHRLSQRRLARRAGASQAWISRLERGEVSPSLESLERLLLVMGESLRIEAERIDGNGGDPVWDGIHQSRSMSERLARALDAASFAGDLRGSAKRR